MFTGIIEELGIVTSLKKENDNLHITLKSSLTPELRIDQSVAHNGVCLTVINVSGEEYTVTAIRETLDKSNLGSIQIGDQINLERSLKLGDRLDGHMVQGHVDQIGTCQSILDQNGSWVFTFSYDPFTGNITIEKGSITINGVSLTVINSMKDRFSVAIIPYTYQHTNFNAINAETLVNLEFDVIGKYVQRITKLSD